MDIKNRPIGIIGHKNPDSDSICSAIAYADLKNQLGGSYTALRAGEMNNETKYILDYFGVSAPFYCQDVKAQVMDIDIRSVKGVPGTTSMRKAWETMRDQAITTLPVIDENEKLIGLITLKDLAMANLDNQSTQFLSLSHTPYQNILDTIHGQLLCGDPDGCITTGKIVVGAASPEVMEETVKPGDLVLVANRYEAQYCAIAAGAGCIIVCTGSAVPGSIIQLAEAHSCAIISTPHDTYPTACMMSQCVPVAYYMLPREKILTFRTTDEISDVKDVMKQYRHVYFPILDTDGQYVGVISRRNLLNLHKKQLILVDHNEKAHCVDGWDEAEILEIIDHHRIGNLESSSPIYFRNQPVGCTATIIYQMYQENQKVPSKQIAGLLLGAIVSDTLNLKSPTCTVWDCSAADALSILSETDRDELAQHMFEAGESLTGKTPEILMYQDYKLFSSGKLKFGVGTGSFLSDSNFALAEQMITDYLAQHPEGKGAALNFFMLTNLKTQFCRLICSSEEAVRLIEKAFGKSADPGVMYVDLPDIVSRKKQLIPPILNALSEDS